MMKTFIAFFPSKMLFFAFFTSPFSLPNSNIEANSSSFLLQWLIIHVKQKSKLVFYNYKQTVQKGGILGLKIAKLKRVIESNRKSLMKDSKDKKNIYELKQHVKLLIFLSETWTLVQMENKRRK